MSLEKAVAAKDATVAGAHVVGEKAAEVAHAAQGKPCHYWIAFSYTLEVFQRKL